MTKYKQPSQATAAGRTHKDLYTMLDQCTYILCNNIHEITRAEESDSTDYNYIEALAQYNQTYFNSLPRRQMLDELGLGWSDSDTSEQDIQEAIQDARYIEVYQTFIIDEESKRILEDYGQIVWNNEATDCYCWGVTHYGTAWSHVMNTEYPVQNLERYTN